ncbi:hypothetical protein SD81_028255 [Tolypothrix campylonemoides VB511288]|nr:hypothetical protein SD81_028255 [Tolypothrix campylonemoides VB511288]
MKNRASILPKIDPPDKLEPCVVCGYTGASAIPMLGDRVAFKCGSCDVFLFSTDLPKQQRRGRR